MKTLLISILSAATIFADAPISQVEENHVTENPTFNNAKNYLSVGCGISDNVHPLISVSYRYRSIIQKNLFETPTANRFSFSFDPTLRAINPKSSICLTNFQMEKLFFRTHKSNTSVFYGPGLYISPICPGLSYCLGKEYNLNSNQSTFFEVSVNGYAPYLLVDFVDTFPRNRPGISLIFDGRISTGISF